MRTRWTARAAQFGYAAPHVMSKGRIIAFSCGVLFGAVGALFAFWLEDSDSVWSVVGLAAFVLGVLAAIFGRKTWEAVVNLWPPV